MARSSLEASGGRTRCASCRVHGVKLETQPKDRNCLAHCLGVGLTWLKGDQKKRPARLVRSELTTL